MPKSPNYKKGIVYKLCCKDPSISECYVGSTLDFKNRKKGHKQGCGENSCHHHLNVYQFIKSNGGWDNWNMIQLEQYEAKDKRDLESRERFYVETLKSSLNKNMPFRTREENKDRQKDYYIKNKDTISDRQKESDIKNKDKISERHKKNVHCECGSEIRQYTLSRHKLSKKHQTFLATK